MTEFVEEIEEDTAAALDTGTAGPPQAGARKSLPNPVIAWIGPGTLRYAAPTESGSARTTARPRVRRIDWYEIGTLAVVLSSGAACLSRLLWAVRP